MLPKSVSSSALWLVASGGAFVAILVGIVEVPWVANLDDRVLQASEPIGTHPGTAMAQRVTDLANPRLELVVLVCAALVIALIRRDARPLLLTVVAVILLTVLVLVAKEWIGRSGPQLGSGRVFSGGSAFPSGHAACATLAGVLGALLLGQGRAPWLRRALLVAGCGWAIAVGWSRIQLGFHWSTDVLSGWALGAFTVALVWLLGDWIAWPTDRLQMSVTRDDLKEHETC